MNQANAAPAYLLDALENLINAACGDMYTDDPDFKPALDNLDACLDAARAAVEQATGGAK